MTDTSQQRPTGLPRPAARLGLVLAAASLAACASGTATHPGKPTVSGTPDTCSGVKTTAVKYFDDFKEQSRLYGDDSQVALSDATDDQKLAAAIRAGTELQLIDQYQHDWAEVVTENPKCFSIEDKALAQKIRTKACVICSRSTSSGIAGSKSIRWNKFPNRKGLLYFRRE